jgi:thiamine pyrophosphate-dependent acetolactate synthase large subunit-like protein
MNFPTPSTFDFAGMQRQLVPEADVVVGLDAPDLFGALRGAADYTTRRTRVIAPAGQRVASIALDDLLVSSWTADYQGLPAVDLPLLGDTGVALPLLLEECRRLVDAPARSRIERRRSALAPRQAALRDKQRAALEAQWDHPQITEARLLTEVWEQVKDDDFVFTSGQLRRMAAGLPQLTRPDQYLAGNGGGGAVGATPGIAVGAGLALKDSGRLPVAIHGDGALLAGIQALWTAVHYEIPSLWVVNNNRSYYNDEDHQDRIAQFRGRPPENRWIAQRMEDPEVDFAGIARTFGVFAEGPITEAGDLAPALARAADVVRRGGFAVVDVWTENRVRG